MSLLLYLNLADECAQFQMLFGQLTIPLNLLEQGSASSGIETIPCAPWKAFWSYPDVFRTQPKDHSDQLQLALKGCKVSMLLGEPF